jgi:hypothetical protein
VGILVLAVVIMRVQEVRLPVGMIHPIIVIIRLLMVEVRKLVDAVEVKALPIATFGRGISK